MARVPTLFEVVALRTSSASTSIARCEPLPCGGNDTLYLLPPAAAAVATQPSPVSSAAAHVWRSARAERAISPSPPSRERQECSTADSSARARRTHATVRDNVSPFSAKCGTSLP
eukprot:CAMPEP_0181230374 /NCGR_PEP_ID=MMETSP1096-20121128/34437_1 /TAXON_ID=156174 ORGANISM="Chrysochromulina ericina, Strain CCMP281" /NCGR_SAMPLE_ID=MMETSP1096 /ASSEMBLY_ACC=CAM_ASM_000453 /LENGTH=114 /DNA_ID=CAMNT_0023324141 /DNA_START=447 /DNA_END=791 /DNA_ORIENTATION=+